jgi:hypothetical protein
LSEHEIVLHAAQEVGRAFGPYLSLLNAGIMLLIFLRLSKATATLDGLMQSLQRLERTIDRVTGTVNHHAEAIARLEGWLERHEPDGPLRRARGPRDE